jgi:hypothetical protein
VKGPDMQPAWRMRGTIERPPPKASGSVRKQEQAKLF